MVGPSSLSVDLRSLSKHSIYSISVVAFTVGDGRASEEIAIATDEDSKIAGLLVTRIYDRKPDKLHHTIPYCFNAMPHTTYHTIPYHTIPYYTIQYYTIQYNTIPYYTIQYYTIPYYTIPYYTILYHTIPFYTIPYHTIPYYTILYHTISYHTIPYNTMMSLLRGSIKTSSYLHHTETPLPNFQFLISHHSMSVRKVI